MEQKISPPNDCSSDPEDAEIAKMQRRFRKYIDVHWDEYVDAHIIAELLGKTEDEAKGLSVSDLPEKDMKFAKDSVEADKMEEIEEDFFDDYSDEYDESMGQYLP